MDNHSRVAVIDLKNTFKKNKRKIKFCRYRMSKHKNKQKICKKI